MRYVILGAGAVGGAIGFRLARAGRDVLLVARGAHGEAIRRRGLTLRTPAGADTAPLRCVAGPADAGITAADLVILAVKAPDAAAAVAELDPGAAVVCAQNGVTTEPVAAARCARVHGMMAWIPALHLEPGVVEVYATAPPGLFRVGGYPSGIDGADRELAADLGAAGFDAEAVPDIMRWKHGKLLGNLGNVVDAFAVPDPELAAIARRAADEGAVVLGAAGLPFIPAADLYRDMRARVDHHATIAGRARGGGSTWQSAVRGLPSEVDHLNGWICDLGARVGVPTPINDGLRRLAGEATGPRTVPRARLRQLIGDGTG